MDGAKGGTAEAHGRDPSPLRCEDSSCLDSGKSLAGVAATPKLAVANDAEAKKAEFAFAKLRDSRHIDRSEVPTLDLTPPKETVPMLARMYHWAQASAIGEAFLPFSLADMMSNVEIATSLVGLPIWQRFYGTAEVKDSEVIPMQLRMLIFQQLVAYESKLRSGEHCFSSHHMKEQASAQAALEAASPKLAKLRSLLALGSQY